MLVRLLALLTGTLVAVGILWLLPAKRGDSLLAFNSLSEVEPIAEKTLEPITKLVRAPLTEAEATKIFRLKRPSLVYDKDAFYVPLGNQNQRTPLAHHPNGEFFRRTNSLGMRRDGELAETKSRFRVGVTGDSHMDGILDNQDNACALAETALRTELGEDSVEVINLAVGGYGFFQFLGGLERCLSLELELDAFILVLYGGNDFADTWLWHYFRGEHAPAVSSASRSKEFNELIQSDPGHFGQYLASAEYTRTHPSEVDVMLQMSATITSEMKRICDENGIQFLVTFLPSPSQVPAQAPMEEAAEIRAKLGLTAQHMEVFDDLADRYLAQLTEVGIESIDLRTAFKAQSQSLYWPTDLHLNLAGHKLLAEEWKPWIRARVPE